MLSEGEITRTIQYISDRRCPGGGYCFYQLDEPNLSDTWYALGCLHTLKKGSPDPDTVRYLRLFHDQTRGISGLYRLWYLFWSYRFLTGSVPDDLMRKLSDCPSPVLYKTGTIESSSIFESLYLYVILQAEAGIKKPDSYRTEIMAAVHEWHHPSGGFGREKGTLVETWHAAAICKALDIPIDTNLYVSFLTRCVDPQSGFVNVPSSHPGYLEHLDAGIALASLLEIPVPNHSLCVRYLQNCRKENGGYARSGYGGNATLEYTWYAIRSLSRLFGSRVWSW